MPGAKRNRDIRKTDVQKKRREALDLRLAGETYDTIAARVGYASRGAAYRAVAKAIARITEEPAKEVLAQELARLDRMFLALWPRVCEGDEAAIDRALRIQERRARYLGIDAPKPVAITAEITGLGDFVAKAFEAMSEEPTSDPLLPPSDDDDGSEPN